MSMNLVELTVNPCKMCMPMGSVSAFMGIRRCMTLLHGSQGCSTYIRRHMATHYNEPVDIASSSLTEQGTVFGGEANLIKGLKNLIALYDPDVIGVATTCLAETIGEDIPRMIRDFYEANPDCRAKIIPVSSAGYAGTQFEGFFAALSAIVQSVDMRKEKHDTINVITGCLSPADTRYLKGLFREMGLNVILLPDLSENLDGGFQKDYKRLPDGGTSLSDIARMAGARLTVELSTFISDADSPAKFLHDTFGVPYVRCHLPMGLRDTDALICLLAQAGGKVTDAMQNERARFMDAMVDSHKYNAEGRAVIFGEPDFVFAANRLCTENGLVPVLTATGARCGTLKALLEQETANVADTYFTENFEIRDACDFDVIEEAAARLNANLLVGSSDGRRIAHKLGLPLIRCAFPVHDSVGGQRIRTLGYEGALSLLDRMTNALLERKESSFRDALYEKYHSGPAKLAAAVSDGDISAKKRTLEQRTAVHPCFNGCGGDYARIHLPVARDCNIQCNYCVRKFDCPNESRPGVTTRVLSPAEALDRYMEAKARIPNLTVVGIAGPGDALADFEKTQKTLQMIRMADKDVTFCLSTNGLMLPQYAEQIAALGVSHVTVTVNAVDAAIGSRIYKHVRYMGQTYTGEAAAAMLLANQMAGIKMIADRGVMVKVNIVMLKGINETHIPAVVEKVKQLGASITNIMQLIPVKGSAFESMPLVSNKEIMAMREKCGETLTQMIHCRQCRADAVGRLDNDESASFCDSGGCGKIAKKTAAPSQKPLLFAVSSHGGVLVDQHFGHATDFYIYEANGSEVRFVERRGVGKYCDNTPGCDGKGGGKQMKFEEIHRAIEDCAAVITMRIGEAPRQKLAEKGMMAFTGFGRIEEAVQDAAAEYNANLMKGII